jgi:hypothetical protein
MTGSSDEVVGLKPCPFCGSDAELERDSDHHGEWFNLGCSRHWGRVPDPDDRCPGGRIWYTEDPEELEGAIAAWNTRPHSQGTSVVWAPSEAGSQTGPAAPPSGKVCEATQLDRLMEVVEAARDLVMKPGGLVNRGVGVGLVVVEKADKSDPHYRLCTAFERLDAYNAIREGKADA